MGFKASDAVQPLDYDFRPFVDVYGVTPEPSNKQMVDFQYTSRDIMSVIGISFDPDNQSEMLEEMQNLSREHMDKIEDAFNEALAKLTSGKPSKEDVQALQGASFRHYRAYIGSLMGDIMDPEASSAAMSRSQAAQTNGMPTLRSVKN